MRVKLSEIVQRKRNIGMIGTKRLFSYRQRRACTTARRRHNDLGLDIESPDCSAILRNIGMIGTECFFSYRQRSLVQRLGIGVTTLGSI